MVPPNVLRFPLILIKSFTIFMPMNDFTEILLAEELPLNGKMVFHFQNDGIGRAFHDDVQVRLSKKSRQVFLDYLRIKIRRTFRGAWAFKIDKNTTILKMAMNFHNGVAQHHTNSSEWHARPSEMRGLVRSERVR